MSVLRSRDNPRVRRWLKLSRDARLRRSERRALIEGPHLVDAYLASGGKPEALIVSEKRASDRELVALMQRVGNQAVLVSDAVFGSIADSESPAGIAAEIALSESPPELSRSPCCVLLEGVQDAGNVGAILRSAAAFGVPDIVLGPGCADPWSPKVLRAGMGGHFQLRVAESDDLVAEVARFRGKVACTVPRGGVALPEADLSGRLAWIFGAEGQGVSEALAGRATLKVAIPMPGGAESLNVAAAAAICFYEQARQRAFAKAV